MVTMKKRKLISIVVLLFFFLCLPKEALFAAEVAVIKSDDNMAYDKALSGFREALGADVNISIYSMKGDSTIGREIIKEVKLKNPQAILAIGARALDISQEEIEQIPIVFCMVFDIQKYKVKGRNITGVELRVPPREQFLVLKTVMPSVRNIGVIYNPDNSRQIVEEGRIASKELSIKLIEKGVAEQQELSRALNELSNSMDVLWLVPDATVASEETFRYFLSFTIERNIPLLVFSESLVKCGALLSVSPDYHNVGSLAGDLINKILKGRAPVGLPIAYPKGEVSVNLHTAETLNIKVPEDVKRKAKTVF